MTLDFTGERFIPGVQGEVALEHLHRYALASKYVDNLKVLDIASGEGYGSEILARNANLVYGADISNDSIKFASEKYSSINNLKFIQCDCKNIPLDENFFDVVVSFETIEHHDLHDEMIQEVKRVLKKDGILIISSPNKLIYSDKPKYKNPYHIKELYTEEFVVLLKKYFNLVELHGQNIISGSVIKSYGDKKELEVIDEVVNNQFKKVSFSAKYDILFCSNKKLPRTSNSIFSSQYNNLFKDKDDDIKRLTKIIKDVDKEKNNLVNELTNTIENVILDRDAKNNQVNELTKTIEDVILDRDAKNNQVNELTKTIENVILDRDAQINLVNELTKTIENVILDRDAQINLVNELTKTIENVVIDRDAQINLVNELTKTIENVVIDRDAQINLVNELTKTIENVVIDRDAQINLVNELTKTIENVVIDRDAQINLVNELTKTIENVVLDRDAQINLVNELTKTIENVVLDRDAKNNQVNELTKLIENVVIDRDAQINLVNELTKTIENVVIDRDAQINLVNELTKTIENVVIDRDAKNNQVNELTKLIENVVIDRDVQINLVNELTKTIENVVIDRDVQINLANELTKTVENVVIDRDAQINLVNKLTKTIENVVIDRDAQINLVNELTKTVENVVIDRDAKNNQINELTKTVENVVIDRDAQINLVNELTKTIKNVVIDRDAQINLVIELTKTIENVVIDRDAQINLVNELTKTIENVVLDRDAQIDYGKNLMNIISKKDEEIYFYYRLYMKYKRSKVYTLFEFLRVIFRFNNIHLHNKISEVNFKKFPQPKKILLVSFYSPSRSHAGGLRILDIYKIIKQKSPNTKLHLFTFYRPEIDGRKNDIFDIFDKVYFSESENLSPDNFYKATENHKEFYDVIDLQFHQLGKYINRYKLFTDKVLFTPMESLSRSFFISLKNLFKSKFPTLKQNLIDGLKEIKYARKADQVVCVSSSDSNFLNLITGKFISLNKNIINLDTCLSPLEFDINLENNNNLKSPKKGKKIIFVAYFGSQTNIDSLNWYLNFVHKKVLNICPEYVFEVVGRGDLSKFKKYEGENCSLVGEVDSLEPFIKNASIGIAPALSGSGFRGKINQYSINSIPTVASKLAAKGLIYKDQYDICIAKTAYEFAEQCIRLLQDDKFNEMISINARNSCLNNYLWESKWKNISNIYNV